jgi:hypothetical protein
MKEKRRGAKLRQLDPHAVNGIAMTRNCALTIGPNGAHAVPSDCLKDDRTI